MIFHPTQSIVAADNTQFRVVDCGRQWGKTTLAVWEMTACAMSKGGKRIRFYATTFTQARDIAWSMLKEITRDIWAKPPNETRLELSVRAVDGGISEISLSGFESVETARGQQFDLLVLDEVSKMHNFKSGWQGALLGTLAFRRGKALFISTPYGKNHFHELYQLGQGLNPLYKSWKFPSHENPHLPKDYLLGIQQTVTPDFWAQEYLADFRRFTGLIYGEFDMVRHVHAIEHTFNEPADYLFGLDFAVRGYTASIAGYIKEDGHLYIPPYAEYKQSNDTALSHGMKIKDNLSKIAEFNKYTGYADPSGWINNQQSADPTRQIKGQMVWSLADEYLDQDFPLVQANNEVVPGINYIKQLFRADKIHIDPSNTMLLDELMQYQWKQLPETRIGLEEEPEAVRKVNDHILDGLRYMAYSKPEGYKREEKEQKIAFPIKFVPKIEEASGDIDNFEPLDIPDIYD